MKPECYIPGLLDRFVVARHPLFGSHHTVFDIVADQVFDLLRGPPQDHHRGAGVPDGHWIARHRGQVCSERSLNEINGRKRESKTKYSEHIEGPHGLRSDVIQEGPAVSDEEMRLDDESVTS